MIKQIYQPVINALNYEKSIINEIGLGTQTYNISHLFDLSPILSATMFGGTTSLVGELSETLSLTSEFTNTFELQLNASTTLESQSINRIEGSMSGIPTLATTIFQGIVVTETINATSTPTAEFRYLMDFTKNISETISMDRRRTHYVWDGGIILK